MAFEELEREVRQDLMMERWKKYRPGIIALSLSVILGVGGYQAWRFYQNQQEIQAANHYFKAEQVLLNDPELGLAAMGDVISNQGTLGYRTIAQFRLAGEYIELKQLDKAQAIFLSIANDNNQSVYFRSLASLQASFLPTKSEKIPKILQLLKPLLAAESPWRHLARLSEVELILRTGDTQQAIEKLDVMINDVSTSSELRNKATQIKAVL